jgi:hypothetical protein
MQMCLPILGGEKVPDYRRFTMPLNSVIVLIFGLCASLTEFLPFKLAFYFTGVSCFCVLVHQMNRVVVDATSGGESLLYGNSMIRQLSVIVVLTWIPFPIWYALSPEGFNVIDNAAAMKIAVAFLNVLSKGLFIFYLMRVRADLETKELVLAEAKVAAEMEDEPQKNDEGEEFTKLTAGLVVVVHDVLRTMGRENDYDALKHALERNMVNSSEDLMVLTPQYCDTVSIPWAFVTACKAKIKQQQVEKGDRWGMNALKKKFGGGEEDTPETFDAIKVTPLPPQVANDPRKLKEIARRRSEAQMNVYENRERDFDNMSYVSGPMSPTSPPSRSVSKQGAPPGFEASAPPQPPSGPPFGGGQPSRSASKQELDHREALQAAMESSQNMLLQELREMKRAQMEETARIHHVEQKVNAEMGSVHEQLGGMMSAVLEAIDKKLPPAAAPAPGKSPRTGGAQLDSFSFSKIPNYPASQPTDYQQGK